MSSSEENKDRSETPGITLDTAGQAVSGASRRSGVIWTNEARNDMFARREAGEGWESICRDYPSRSRHAMQQQYSMMKKQKMMAEGTWTMNRRGRKRKAPIPGVVGFQRRESGMDDTENDMSVTPSDLEADDADDMLVDDMDMGTPQPEIHGPAAGGVQSVLDFNRDPRISGRPSPLSRSATDPAPPGRGRGRGRGGRIPSTYTMQDGGQPALAPAPKSFTPVNPADNTTAKPAKRMMHDGSSLSPAAKRQKPLADNQLTEEDETEEEPLPPFSNPGVLFTQEQISEFLRMGVANHAKTKALLDLQDTNHKAAMTAAQERSNRRVREHEDRLKEVTYRHRADVRAVEENQKHTIAQIRQDYEETVRNLEADLIVARGGVRSTTDVKATIDSAHQAMSNQKANAHPGSDDQEAQFLKLINALEDLKLRYESEQSRRKKAETRITALEQQLAARNDPGESGISVEMTAHYKQLDGLLKALEAEAGDLPPRAMTQRLADANMQCARLASFIMPQSQPAPLLQQGPYASSPHLSGVMPIVQSHQAPAHHASLSTHGVHRPLSNSVSSSPVPEYRSQGPAPSSHPGLPPPSESPSAPATVDQRRPYVPVSIHSLISQEPQQTLPAAQNVLPPLNRSANTHSPQSRAPPPPPPPPPSMASSQHPVPAGSSQRPGSR